MSFEVYLQVFADGAPAGLALDAIRAAFAGHLVELEPDFWRADYADGQSCDLFLQPPAKGDARVHCLSVHRPCPDPRLWHALYALLQTPGSLLHFPGGVAPLARDPAAAVAGMSASTLESLGTPVPVDSAEALQAAVVEADQP